MLTAFATIVAPCAAQQPLATPFANWPADRGLAADPFEIAMARGFFLRARERMIYLNQRTVAGDEHGWRAHRFVSNQGRPILIRLPCTARIFIWLVGQGPRPIDSTCPDGFKWGYVPSFAMKPPTAAEQRRLRTLWEHSQERSK